MASLANRGSVYRFGTFEVLAASREIFRHGHRVKLQDQPFQLLLLLLENAGEIVDRELIRQHLWPENTFVDFGQSLGTAVTKLRQALGDDADNPRFVETIPRRGYRFIAPVSLESAIAPKLHAGPHATPPDVPQEQRTEELSPSPLSTSPRSRWQMLVWPATVTALLGGVFAMYSHNRRPVFALAPKDSLSDWHNHRLFTFCPSEIRRLFSDRWVTHRTIV
jgi:DNA-binding winged helix-turn-helix (wHTH) protein